MKEDDEAAGAELHLELEEGYRIRVGFGGDAPSLVMDEPVPLGAGSGPNAQAVLGAAVGDCLSASLLYCLRKARGEVTGLRAEVVVRPVRNAKGRLRIGSVRVELDPEVAAGSEGRLDRCLELFENFCVVTGSVRHGIDVEVAVTPDVGGSDVALGCHQPDEVAHGPGGLATQDRELHGG